MSGSGKVFPHVAEAAHKRRADLFALYRKGVEVLDLHLVPGGRDECVVDGVKFERHMHNEIVHAEGLPLCDVNDWYLPDHLVHERRIVEWWTATRKKADAALDGSLMAKYPAQAADILAGVRKEFRERQALKRAMHKGPVMVTEDGKPVEKQRYRAPSKPELVGLYAGGIDPARLRAKIEAVNAEIAELSKLTEPESFIVEAAMQNGFEFVDDDATVLAVSSRAFVDFVHKVSDAAIQRGREMAVAEANGVPNPPEETRQ